MVTRNRSGRAGYSLLEVLIAMSILMIGIVGVYRLFPVAMRDARMAEEKILVSELADARIGLLRTIGARVVRALSVADNADDFRWLRDPTATALEGALDQYSMFDGYTTSLQPLGGAAELGLQRVLFTVDMPDGRREIFVTYVVEH